MPKNFIDLDSLERGELLNIIADKLPELIDKDGKVADGTEIKKNIIDSIAARNTFTAFHNNGYITHDKRFTVKDIITSEHLNRFVPHVIQTMVVEAMEPRMVVVPNLFQQMNIQNGVILDISTIGALTATEYGENQPAPEISELIDDTGTQINIVAKNHGLALSITEDAINDSQFDVIRIWLRAAGRALARHKEQYAIKLINGYGFLIYDNVAPTTSGALEGSTTGRNIAGAGNGTFSLNDLFKMYAWLAMRGFAPDTVLMHPLAWQMFAVDPELREVVISGSQLVSEKMPNGSADPGWGSTHNGAGLFLKATGSTTLPPAGVSTWATGLSPWGATFNIPPKYMPTAFRVLISPLVPYNATGSTGGKPTSSLLMADSSMCGVLVQREGVKLAEWSDPERDVRKMRLKEKYGMGVLGQGKAIGIARGMVLDRNYAFNNVNSATLAALSTTATYSTA